MKNINPQPIQGTTVRHPYDMANSIAVRAMGLGVIVPGWDASKSVRIAQVWERRAQMPSDPQPAKGFDVGARVRLRAESADRWADPKLMRRAKAQRAATVTAVIGTALPVRRRSYRIEFDRVGRERAFSETIPIYELEAIQ